MDDISFDEAKLACKEVTEDFVDVQQRGREFPQTFWVPSEALLNNSVFVEDQNIAQQYCGVDFGEGLLQERTLLDYCPRDEWGRDRGEGGQWGFQIGASVR